MKRHLTHIIIIILNIVFLSIALVFGILTKNGFTTSIATIDEIPIIQRSANAGLLNPNGSAEGIMSISDMQNDATDIVECVFTGERRYGYQALISTARVTKVNKGTLNIGDDIFIFEPVQILPINSINYPLTISDKTIKAALNNDDAKIVRASPISSYVFGKNPMNVDCKYLVFLKQKTPNMYKQKSEDNCYRMIDCAYSRILINEDPKIDISETPSVMYFKDACQIDQVVSDIDSQKLYLDTCKHLISQYSS
ncbi:hypothetical protein [Fannyhessea vaginae]|uniref:hypothetical protein n=2 Tax=Fannyhessea vaginae TaxID=82135 RepID=UPI003A7FDCE4